MGCEGPALWSLRGYFSTDGGLFMQIDSTSIQIRYSYSIDSEGFFFNISFII